MVRASGMAGWLCVALAGVVGCGDRPAELADATAVVVLGQEPALPIPTVGTGTGNQEVSDLLFLRLADMGPALNPSDTAAFQPRLARTWVRRDSLTLAFVLEPRARWHDGQPVTAQDVVWSMERARDPRIAPILAALLRQVTAVAAEGDTAVAVRFARPYLEQLYDATQHVQVLPGHLLSGIAPESLATAPFASAPIGSGPYRWVQRVSGQYVELAAVPEHFLGSPQVRRLLIRSASDPEARFNLLLGGQADGLDNIVPPLANLDRLGANPALRTILTPSLTVGYVLFNQRSRGDRSRPHPILGDVEVRRALIEALDREAINQAVFGSYSRVPVGPVSQALWIGGVERRAAPADTAAARRRLAARGWSDRDGDGVLDRAGRSLTLTISIPSTSAARRQIAVIAQEQWRRLGLRVEVSALDFPVFIARRSAGDFDMDISSATQDPSPLGLVQSWSCAGVGGSNVGGYCNPRVDSLIARARFARTDPRPIWDDVVATIEGDAPAAFLYAPAYVTALHRRFEDVELRPNSWWSAIWRWRVVPEVSRTAEAAER